MKLVIHNINEEFIKACEYNRIDRVKFLLTYHKLFEKADIHTDNDLAIVIACRRGYLELVQFLTCSPELSEHAYFINSLAFNLACSYGQVDVVKFLISLNKKHLVINEVAISLAVAHRQIKILEYFKQIDQLDQYINVHTFRTMIDTENEELLKFFIVDCGIKLTEPIRHFLVSPYICMGENKKNYLYYELLKKRALILFSTL